MKDKETLGKVDTRILSSGQIRLRFKLSESAYNLVRQATNLTKYKHVNAAIDAISMNYISCDPFTTTELECSANGSKRFIVRLYADQYELVRVALDIARQNVDTDADALVLMCIWFMETESIVCSKGADSVVKPSGFLRLMASRL